MQIINYSYQYDDANIIMATVSGTKVVSAPNSFQSLKRFEVMGYVYDAESKIAFIPKKDETGELVLVNGKAVKDDNRLNEKVQLS